MSVITKERAQRILEDAQLALECLGEQHGVVMTFLEPSRFKDDAVRLGRVLVRPVEDVERIEQDEFRKRYATLGLSIMDLGEPMVSYDNIVFTIVGAIPGAPTTSAIRVKNRHGYRFAVSAEEAKQGRVEYEGRKVKLQGQIDRAEHGQESRADA